MKNLIYSEYFEIIVDVENNIIFKVHTTDDHLLCEIQGSRRKVTPEFATKLCSGNTRKVLASLTESATLTRVFLINPISYSSPCYKRDTAISAFKKMWEETHQRDGFIGKYKTSLYMNRKIYDNEVEKFFKNN